MIDYCLVCKRFVSSDEVFDDDEKIQSGEDFYEVHVPPDRSEGHYSIITLPIEELNNIENIPELVFKYLDNAHLQSIEFETVQVKSTPIFEIGELK